jgi:hypothetical protein
VTMAAACRRVPVPVYSVGPGPKRPGLMCLLAPGLMCLLAPALMCRNPK